MKNQTAFETVNPRAAGIDVGSEKFFVSIDGSAVKTFTTFTEDYQHCIRYLKDNGIQRVAMHRCPSLESCPRDSNRNLCSFEQPLGMKTRTN